MRLNKFISESGLCSRREADRYISQGSVFINGRKAIIGDQVQPGDQVKVNGNLLEPLAAEDLVFIALNKPVGITSTTEDKIATNIIDFVNHSSRIFPIGRLDKDSEGLLILTNDGYYFNKTINPSSEVEKEYIVTVNKSITQEFIIEMSKGVEILGQITLPCKMEFLNEFTFKIILVQGLNRQIRRMCFKLNYMVNSLKRVRIGKIHLENLQPKEFRMIDSEMQVL